MTNETETRELNVLVEVEDASSSLWSRISISGNKRTLDIVEKLILDGNRLKATEYNTNTNTNSFGLPPHANAEAHQALMKRLSGMSADEIFQTAVEAGIYTKSGKLTKHYASNVDNPND